MGKKYDIKKWLDQVNLIFEQEAREVQKKINPEEYNKPKNSQLKPSKGK